MRRRIHSVSTVPHRDAERCVCVHVPHSLVHV